MDAARSVFCWGAISPRIFLHEGEETSRLRASFLLVLGRAVADAAATTHSPGEVVAAARAVEAEVRSWPFTDARQGLCCVVARALVLAAESHVRQVRQQEAREEDRAHRVCEEMEAAAAGTR